MAFAKGTLYFRHGAKSEATDSHDLKSIIDRARDSARSSLLTRIKAVLSIPVEKQGQVVLLDPQQQNQLSVVLSERPGAKVVGLLDLNKTRPYRQKDVIEQVNKALKDKGTVNQYDIHSIRRVYGIDQQQKYCYKPLHSSAHFSHAFVDWIVDEFEKNTSFFKETRLKNRESE